MTITLKLKYRQGFTYKGMKTTSDRNSPKRAKGLDHPIGLSGATTGRMIRAFRTKK